MVHSSRLEELGVTRRAERGLGGRVHRVEDALQPLGEAELGEAGLRLGEGADGVADQRRPFPEMRAEPSPGEAPATEAGGH